MRARQATERAAQ